MRNERDMMELILGFAREDERVRAVLLNGSRANPGAAGDLFQDYDIVYVVEDVEGMSRNRGWIERFGERIIMQLPDAMEVYGPEQHEARSFAFLMLFADGNRIDLTLYPAGEIALLPPDSLSRLLLDKDGIVGSLPEPSDRDYLPKPPTAGQFDACCNEFWWVSTYIAKGLWRGELYYARFHFERPVRDMLARMLNWHIGVRTGFAKDPGKLGKYFARLLEPWQWEAWTRTFPDGSADRMWEALFDMCALFRETARQVAGHYGYEYPEGDDERVTAYLQHVRDLPRDATSIT